MKLEEKFWKNTVRDPDTNCWEWTGAVTGNGKYRNGIVIVENKKEIAYRFSYFLHKGEIPQGNNLVRSCENRNCVNPEHIVIKTAVPAENRFWKYVISSGDDECWEWRGSRNKRGYGHFRPDTKSESKKNSGAHRYSYILHNGPISEGLVVCHKCDNPPCVNPSHLFLGTDSDNVHDMVSKGRHRAKGMLSEDSVRSIRAMSASGISVKEIAQSIGATCNTVWSIKTGRSRKSTI